MFRCARSHVPAARRSTRIARATTTIAAAVLAVGAALTGCTVALDGTPHGVPRPVARSTPETTTDRTTAPRSDEYRAPRSVVGTPPLPLDSGEPLAPHAEVLAQWVVDGWTPLPLLRVTDPGTGVSAAMFGPAQERPTEVAAPHFEALGAPSSVVSTFGVIPMRPGYRPDAEAAAQRLATMQTGGRLVSSVPVDVHGHTGSDVRIEFRSSSGREVVQLIRLVELPHHLIGLESIGLRSDERVLGEVQQIVTSTLTTP